MIDPRIQPQVAELTKQVDYLMAENRSLQTQIAELNRREPEQGVSMMDHKKEFTPEEGKTISEMNQNLDALALENMNLHMEVERLRRSRSAMIKALMVLCEELEGDCSE